MTLLGQSHRSCSRTATTSERSRRLALRLPSRFRRPPPVLRRSEPARRLPSARRRQSGYRTSLSHFDFIGEWRRQIPQCHGNQATPGHLLRFTLSRAGVADASSSPAVAPITLGYCPRTIRRCGASKTIQEAVKARAETTPSANSNWARSGSSGSRAAATMPALVIPRTSIGTSPPRDASRRPESAAYLYPNETVPGATAKPTTRVATDGVTPAALTVAVMTGTSFAKSAGTTRAPRVLTVADGGHNVIRRARKSTFTTNRLHSSAPTIPSSICSFATRSGWCGSTMPRSSSDTSSIVRTPGRISWILRFSVVATAWLTVVYRVPVSTTNACALPSTRTGTRIRPDESN